MTYRTQGPRRRSIFTDRLVSSSVEGAQPNVLDDMRAAILDGEEPPGTLIPIDAVATFFGVSPIPVREALRVLVGQGLVEHTPNVGYSVARIGFDEFCEIYDVRLALEIMALRSAIPRATLLDDDAVKSIHAAMAQAMDAGDERGLHAASRLFHTALITPSGKSRMLGMYESAWNVTEPVRPMSRVPEQERARFYADHDKMLAAFIARDADALEEHTKTHYANLRAAIEQMGSDWDGFRQ